MAKTRRECTPEFKREAAALLLDDIRRCTDGRFDPAGLDEQPRFLDEGRRPRFGPMPYPSRSRMVRT